jgi:NADH-quinone oxidoreductase subunit B
VQIHCGFAFATSCCGIEFMATMASHYDLARFGSERVSFFTSSSGYVDGNGYDFKENGAYITSGLRTNVRASWVIAGACALQVEF